jgi:hypothetical protein
MDGSPTSGVAISIATRAQGHNTNGGSNGGPSPSTNANGRPRSSGGSLGGKRQRNGSIAGINSSPNESLENEDEEDHSEDGHDDKRRAPGVKRACNECRQQKVCSPCAQSGV